MRNLLRSALLAVTTLLVPAATALGCSDAEEPASAELAQTTGDAGADAAEPIPRPSALVAELVEAGVDVAAPLSALTPAARRSVMRSFTRSLGVECSYCHVADDFAAPTRNKKIASRMWSDFVGGLALKDGGALYCDSCHAGRPVFLDRSSPAAVRPTMSAFVRKLERRDGSEHACATCHGAPLEPDIFGALWQAE